MPRLNTFTFRVDENEMKQISILAHHLHRSRSDAIRFAVHLFVEDLVNPNKSDLKTKNTIEKGNQLCP